MNNFTRGIMVGAIIGATMSMMARNNRTFGLSKKTMKSGKRFIRTASNIIGNLID